jgi:transposase
VAGQGEKGKPARIGARLVEDEEYQIRHERVAGIDIAKASAVVCVRLPPAREGGRRVYRTDAVGSTVPEVAALAARLLDDGIEMVTMESTSDYWRVFYYVLEAAGLRVQLVNSSIARQLAGRPKTDRLDAQWLARLTEMGLLRPSFVPPPEIRRLRDFTRTRLQLVRDRTREWQRLEKLLEGALVKLSSVLSSLARTKTARLILEAMTGGEPGPRALAELAAGRARGKRDKIAAALTGSLFGGHHVQLTRVHLDHIAFLDRKTGELDDEIAACLAAIPAARGVDADGTASPDPGPAPAVLPAAKRLAEIPGVTEDLAAMIIAETGLDMTRFPTAAHLVSWAGLAPVAQQSGPRAGKPKKGKGDGYLRGYCTQAAAGAAPTDTFLGERHRRISRHRGALRARCATARSILVIIWHLLADPEARYADLGPDWHARRINREKKISDHIRQLRALGLDVTVTPTAA